MSKISDVDFITIGLMAALQFDIGPCRILISANPNGMQVLTPIENTSDNLCKIELVELSVFRVGDFKWTMGCTKDKETLCIYLGKMVEGR